LCVAPTPFPLHARTIADFLVQIVSTVPYDHKAADNTTAATRHQSVFTLQMDEFEEVIQVRGINGEPSSSSGLIYLPMWF
jgi:hypothetical protein